MNLQKKLIKIESIIESCQTYGQLVTCLSFIDNPTFIGDNISAKKDVLLIILKKANYLRDKYTKDDVNNLNDLLRANVPY
jgi:hypothetical protein